MKKKKIKKTEATKAKEHGRYWHARSVEIRCESKVKDDSPSLKNPSAIFDECREKILPLF